MYSRITRVVSRNRVINAVALGHVDPPGSLTPWPTLRWSPKLPSAARVKVHRNPRLGLAVPQGFHPAAEGLGS